MIEGRFLGSRRPLLEKKKTATRGPGAVGREIRKSCHPNLYERCRILSWISAEYHTGRALYVVASSAVNCIFNNFCSISRFSSQMCFIFTNFFRSTAHNVKLYHSVGNTIAILERIFTVKAASDSIECRNFWSDIIFGLFFHLFSGARRYGEPPSRECWNPGHGGENLSALFLSHIFLHFIVFVILYLSKTIIFSIYFFLASLLRLFFL